jgi:hypothetical protein
MSSSPGGTTQASSTNSTPRTSKINSPTAMDALLKIDVSALSPDVIVVCKCLLLYYESIFTLCL